MGADLSPRVSPVSVSFNLATAPISPARAIRARSPVFPCMLIYVRAFPGSAAEVLQRRIILQHARENFEIGILPENASDKV